MEQLSFNVTYDGKSYRTNGQVKTKGKYTYLEIGGMFNSSPCISIRFDRVKGICKIEKIRVKKSGVRGFGNRYPAFSPPLPKYNALDILILLSLKLIKTYIGFVPTYINDDDIDNYSSIYNWSGSTLSKNGFRPSFTFKKGNFLKLYLKYLARMFLSGIGFGISYKYNKIGNTSNSVGFNVGINDDMFDGENREWEMHWHNYENITNQISID